MMQNEKYEVQVERFFNKEQNFSISWYPDVKALYQSTIQTQISHLENKNKSQKGQKDKNQKKKHEKIKRGQPSNTKDDSHIRPMFIFAHELYDALPIHQFKYLGGEDWAEMAVHLKRKDDFETGKITIEVPS